jgi:tetratricopeptide (TPR) repeat protein
VVRTEPEPPAPVEVAGATVPADLGGVEVRLRVWRSTLDLVLEHPLLGVGPGQFAVRFPAQRDARERELSSWGYRVENTTEVEHPHNDWLLPWAEGGVVAGLAWWGFLVGALVTALRILRGHRRTSGEDGEELVGREGLAAAVLGALLAALFNGPLLYGPVASVASFLALGGLRGDAQRRSGYPGDRLATVLTPGLVLLLLFHAPRALELWRHGEALGDLTTTTSTTLRSDAIGRALAACPDSPVALGLDGRLKQDLDGDLEGALERWREVLAVRPLRFEARHQEGVLLARLRRSAEARAAFERASEIDPREPRLRRNRVRLAALSGRTEEALAGLDDLLEEGRVDAVWIRDLASEAALEGAVESSLSLFERADPRFTGLDGDAAWALEQEYRQGGSPHAADGLRALAHLLWARQHAEQGAWSDARRSYFQALRVQRGPARPGGSTASRLEFAAALALEGRRAEAEQELDGLDTSAVNWLALPTWSREPLFELGAGSLGSGAGN